MEGGHQWFNVWLADGDKQSSLVVCPSTLFIVFRNSLSGNTNHSQQIHRLGAVANMMNCRVPTQRDPVKSEKANRHLLEFTKMDRGL